MKVLVQRVVRGSVTICGEETGRVGAGLVVLVGMRSGDSAVSACFLARKTTELRIFKDAQGRMNRSLIDIGGAVLVISQFTLYAETHKGNRPSFIRAGDPAVAESIYNVYVNQLVSLLGAERVQTGCFGSEMQVEIINDGPVTIELNTDAESV